MDLFVCVPTDALSHTDHRTFSTVKFARLVPCRPTKVVLRVWFILEVRPCKFYRGRRCLCSKSIVKSS